MSYDRFKDAFDRDGFVIVRQFLSPEDLGTLKDELDRYIRDVVPTLPDSGAFYQDRARPETLKQLQHMAGDRFFGRYQRDPRWLAAAEALVGEPVEPQGPEWFNKPPGTEHPTPPHQDNYYFCLHPPNVVTIWIALDPVDDENGCLRYVVGSHAQGIRPHGASSVLGFSQGITDYGPEDEEREQAIHLEPGDVVAHHGELIHRADANHSTRHRRAFAIVFEGVSCKRDKTAHARYTAALRQQHEQLGLEVD